MKRLLLVALVGMALPVHGAMYKCTESNGRVSYQEAPCEAGAKSSAVQIQEKKPSKWSKADKLDVDSEVVRECYEGYRRYSLDPSKAEMLGHSAMVADAGFPVLHVSAVFRNRAGGPNRELLWCKLTDDLKLDKPTMEERWKAFFIKTNG
ncbi:MAG: DUF4124 domain-containing protein [Sulfurimicrobium sp.]|nr:DUF4124 domain-containing protein [Sulfurimicrobium sp.]